MPRVEFLESALGRAKTVEAPDGGALVDLCDAHYAPIPFSCRSATCATCHVIVAEGLELFEPPSEVEAELLGILRGPVNGRLACQAVLRPGAGVVRLKSVDG